ncbi:ferritin-like domain-containing protein [Pseudomonas sp.]|jgi:rubrerythrin|uniref:ferritin-like domain-containing protein n=1 Tax=Pseudomonas sp. TaxID=306 RepID=UPI002EDA6238
MSDTELKLGMNRTGAQMSPLDTQKQIEATELFPADVPADGMQLFEERQQAIVDADAVGSIPIPGSAKGMVKSALDKLRGHNPEVLVDKLGERLAFERTGVRLYDAMIAKASSATGGSLELTESLRQIQSEEHDHMEMVRRAIETLGADPTSMTPCADVAGVKALGVMQVLTDPRTTVSQCLNAILTIELEDNDAWGLLIELTRQAGHPLIAKEFQHALEQEEKHLSMVRSYVRENLMAQVS